MKRGARSQLAFSQEAQTSLPTSKAEPIMIIGIAAALKIAVSPTTE